MRAGLRLAPPPLDREDPLPERALPDRDALLRLREDAAVFERDAPLALDFDPDDLDPFPELLVLRRVEDGLFVAIP